MSVVSFEGIPLDVETPGAYIEFDNSKANTGLPVVPHVILVLGQRLATGTVAANTPLRVNNASEAANFFGLGSMLAEMIAALKVANDFTEVHACALDDSGGGVAATGDITFSGTVTAAGTLYLRIAGEKIDVAIASGEASSATATKVAAAITARADLPVTAAVNGGDDTQVDLTARHKGETGNDLDVRVNYFDGERMPTGLIATIVALTGGSGNPDITTALAAIGDTQYRTIIMPYTDASNLVVLEAEMDDRFGPMRMIEGMAYTCKRGTVSALGTFGAGRNSPHICVMGVKDAPQAPYIWAAALGGVAAFYGAIDPGRPFQTLALPGMLAPAIGDQFTRTERQILLGADGVATYTVNAGGEVQIERLVTTYKTNEFALPDPSYHDVNTLLVLHYLRFTLRARILQKFPRFKLADDGTRFGAGNATVTPKIIRAEIIALFVEWERAGLAEDIEQFQTDLVVQRNATDKNRLDAIIPTNVINQLRVFAGKVEFRL